MNLTDFHHTCMAGEKIYNSSRILHALHVLKKNCKTGGCLLKISDQDHRIRVGGWVGGWYFLLSEPSENIKYPTREKKGTHPGGEQRRASASDSEAPHSTRQDTSTS